MDLDTLLKQLQIRFENKLPSKEITSYQLGYLIGQQSVINYLESLKESLVKDVVKRNRG